MYPVTVLEQPSEMLSNKEEEKASKVARPFQTTLKAQEGDTRAADQVRDTRWRGKPTAQATIAVGLE